VNGAHDPGELAAHALGLLDGRESAAVQAHLSTCSQCRREYFDLRETSALLEEVPPEMFLEGPPHPDADLVLQRALWQVRGESRTKRGRRRVLLASAAVVTGLALAGGTVLITQAVAPGSVTAAPVPGTVSVQGSDGAVVLAADVVPARGWVKLTAHVSGIPAGERCEIVVVGKDGSEAFAGGWVTGSDPAGATVEGSAAIAPDQVASVVVRNEAGREFVSAAV
jgi:RNA polymerase sigma-70 factor (ECF subfamily)